MKLIEPFQFSVLAHPWLLLLLLALPLLFLAEVTARAPGALTISTGETLARTHSRGREWLRYAPPLLRALGLAFLIVALAKPLQGFQVHKERADIVDIMLCVDVSGSMQILDFDEKGQRRDRLYVTKEAVRDFVQSRKARTEDRFGLDRVGLVLYGAYAWTQCPLTLDYGVLEREIESAEISEESAKSGQTAIGSAIGLAVSRLRKSEAESKVIVLLTDGVNNAGELDPITAAGIAKDYGIRIYTIGAGSKEGGYAPQRTIFGDVRLVPASSPIDEDTLKRIADVTGAKFYRATDIQSLTEAYAEINKLETTKVEIGDISEYQIGFVPYAVAGACLLLASLFSRRQWFEAIP